MSRLGFVAQTLFPSSADENVAETGLVSLSCILIDIFQIFNLKVINRRAKWNLKEIIINGHRHNRRHLLIN